MTPFYGCSPDWVPVACESVWVGLGKYTLCTAATTTAVDNPKIMMPLAASKAAIKRQFELRRISPYPSVVKVTVEK